MKELKGDTLEMASGFRLAIYPTSSGASFTLQVSNSRRARVIRADIAEPNGILFVIDGSWMHIPSASTELAGYKRNTLRSDM